MKNIQYQTPSQTVGPYFAYGLTAQQYHYNFSQMVGNMMVDPTHPNAIEIIGKVLDGAGNPIEDAMIEIWHKDSENELFGRMGTGTNKSCEFNFHCLKPLAENNHAPFLTVILFMRGQLTHSYTRIYFEDEMALNENDAVFQSIPKERRASLLAKKRDKYYEFNIYMQGENETVFFDL
ncbi:MAG: hypothetical protein RIR51_458 [Bacteroidota bacterium]|jgi:protocatechuate 3,4-dioxygenase alpha subunit